MLNLRIGVLLGIRHIQRANPWTTFLIITVIVFTFLNLVLISGVLMGIVDGALETTRKEASGDLLFEPLPDEDKILKTEQVLSELSTYDAVEAYSAHYTELATIEANYKERRDLNAVPDSITVTISGIDPENERRTTEIVSTIHEGEYFRPDESGYVLIGKYNLDRYADRFAGALQTLENVYPGDTVRITAGTHSEEFIVKGIVDSKIDLLSFKVFMPERELRRFYDRPDFNASQILLKFKPGYGESEMKDLLLKNGMGAYANLKTFTEGTPTFVLNVIDTFAIVGLFVGFIGITVAAITIFIVIFINALSRKRQIGILKAIGISKRTIEYAYAIQAAFYTIIGSIIGVCLTVFLIVPYFRQHPIDFPYGDASLTVTPEGIVARLIALFCITIIAGFVPAWLITKQDTLNSILGRK